MRKNAILWIALRISATTGGILFPTARAVFAVHRLRHLPLSAVCALARALIKNRLLMTQCASIDFHIIIHTFPFVNLFFPKTGAKTPVFADSLLFVNIFCGLCQKTLYKTEKTMYNMCINNDIIHFGALAQLGAHNTGSVGVIGSSPLCSTRKSTCESKCFFYRDRWGGGHIVLKKDKLSLYINTNVMYNRIIMV